MATSSALTPAGGSAASSAAIRSHSALILGQSSTVSRTSESTRSSAAAIGLMRLVGALAVELHVHPRLDVLAELALAHRVDVEDLLQDAGGVTADDELRVHHEVHGALLARQLGGDRVDEERHVVGDDLDDAVAAGPAVLLHRRGGDAHVGRADRPVGGDLLVRQRGTEQVLGGAGQEVLGGHVAVVAAQEALGRLTPSPVRELCSRVQLLGTGLVKRRRHGLFPHEMVPSGARRCTPRPSLSLEPGPGTPGRAEPGAADPLWARDRWDGWGT